MIGHSMPIVHTWIRANGPCMFKTGGRTDTGQMAFWADWFGGEKFLGERTDILYIYRSNLSWMVLVWFWNTILFPQFICNLWYELFLFQIQPKGIKTFSDFPLSKKTTDGMFTVFIGNGGMNIYPIKCTCTMKCSKNALKIIGLTRNQIMGPFLTIHMSYSSSLICYI